MAVWVTTDLHGNYDLWSQIKNFLKEDDTLIFLGDAIDRGSRGFEIFKELLQDDRVVYIKGNHEDLMYNAFTAIGLAGTQYFKDWRANGGQATLDNIKAIGIDAEAKMEFVNTIAELPTYAEYESDESGLKFILCHAGYTPGPVFDSLDPWQKERKFIWDRSHWNLPWPTDNPEYDNVIIVHGHTPILYQKQLGFNHFTGMSPAWYENNHKVNLDAATANTGLAFLLNLDTLDYEFFAADPDFAEENERKR